MRVCFVCFDCFDLLCFPWLAWLGLPLLCLLCLVLLAFALSYLGWLCLSGLASEALIYMGSRGVTKFLIKLIIKKAAPRTFLKVAEVAPLAIEARASFRAAESFLPLFLGASGHPLGF